MLTNKFKDSVFEKIVLLLFIITSIFLISMSMVIGQVTIDNIDISEPIYENTELVATISASTDTENDIMYSIYYDGVLLSNTDTLSMELNYSSAGIHNILFFVSDIESNVSEMRTINILDVPTVLTLNNPTSRTYNSRTINIDVSVSTYANQCNYTINYSAPDLLLGLDQNFYKTITLAQDGRYILLVNCSNDFDSASVSSTFNIDTLNPVITSKSYSIDVHNVVTLNAVTDVTCSCKYDTVDRTYDSMTSLFVNTNSQQHSTIINGLADGAYTYYIKCKNQNDNIANTESVSFNIVTRPSASISLSKSPPIKAGTYEVTLVTSRPVNNAPTLYYNFDNDASPRHVTLTGSNTNWKGYMIIEDNLPNKVGTFHYSATDFNGNTGNIITSGEIFLVDTTKPVPPISMDAVEEPDGDIRLKWYYDGETAKRYNIYKSTSGEPDYVDYYDSTTSQQYVDNDVIDGITYYYRIAAVDDADNDGELSYIIEATSNKVYSYNTISGETIGNNILTPQILDYSLVPKVDQLTAEFRIYLTDIAAVKSELDEITDPNKLKVINILKLSENTKTAQVTINGLINKANDLKNQNLQVSELDIQLNKLRMDAIKAKSLVAEDIIVSEQSSYDQVTQESDVDQAISEVVTVNLSRNILNNYSLTNKQMQDNVVVNTEIFIFRIKYLGKDDYDKYTLVKKVVTSSQELKDVSIIEIIPKSFERKASDILFDIDNQQVPVVVKEDPVLRWDADIFNKQTIYYMINNNAEMSAAKDTKTVVLYSPDFKVTQTIQDEEDAGNFLTGLVSLETVDISNISPIQWLVVIGIGMILGLSAYYVALDKKEKKRNIQRLKDHKIISKNQVKLNPMPTQQTVSRVNTVAGNISTTKDSKSKIVPVPVKSSSQDLVSDVNARLDKANTLINNFDYEGARVLYNWCMQQYPKIVFKSATDKNNTKLMLDHLFQKITVYRIIYVSRKHVSTKNYTLLKQDIALISKICNKLYSNLAKIDEDNMNVEKKFVDYVSNSKRYLESISS